MRRNWKRDFVAACMISAATAFPAGCQREMATPNQGPAASTAVAPTAPAAASAPASSATAGAKVAKIVFVGKKEACDCTRARVDESLAALRTALADRTDIAIEQLEQDVDEAKVAQLEQLRPLMVLPGIYLLDGSGALIDLLQGEVTAERFRTAFGEG